MFEKRLTLAYVLNLFLACSITFLLGCGADATSLFKREYHYSTFPNNTLSMSLPGLQAMMAYCREHDVKGSCSKSEIQVCIETSRFEGEVGRLFATDASFALGIWLAALSEKTHLTYDQALRFIEKETCDTKSTEDGELIISASTSLEGAGLGGTGSWSGMYYQEGNKKIFVSIDFNSPLVAYINPQTKWKPLLQELEDLLEDNNSTFRCKTPQDEAIRLVNDFKIDYDTVLHEMRFGGDEKAWIKAAIDQGKKWYPIFKNHDLRRSIQYVGQSSGLFSILLHELGHTMGLAHSNETPQGGRNDIEDPASVFTDNRILDNSVMATPARYNKTPLFITDDDLNGLGKIVEVAQKTWQP